MADLETAKRALVEVLKDKTQRYWELMKNWYKRRISKEDFDAKVRSMLGEGNVQLHNEFLFAILVRCQTGMHPDAKPGGIGSPHTQYSISGKATKRQKLSPPMGTIPYGALDPLQYHTPSPVQIMGKDLDSLMLCSHELMLPDLATLHTRMLLGAWEAGLEGVSGEAATLLMLALETHLKTVIQAVISHRTSWRLRYGCFQHSFGSGLASRALPPTSSTTEKQAASGGWSYPGDVTEAEAALMAAQSASMKQLEPLTLFHLRDALRVNQQCIPVHMVYACHMERILSTMWHPSLEEEEQQRAVEQWRRTLEPPVPFTISATRYGNR